MHIIVFAHRLATPRSITLTAKHLAWATAGATLAMALGAATMYFASLKYAASLKLPFLESLVTSTRANDVRNNDEFLRQNLNATEIARMAEYVFAKQLAWDERFRVGGREELK